MRARHLESLNDSLVAVSDVARIEAATISLRADIGRVEAAIGEVSLEEEAEAYCWPPQVKRWLRRDTYYKGLAAYCQLFQPKTALELGTCTGASAVSLAKNCPNVTTCDITDRGISDPQIFGDRIAFIKLPSPTDVLDLDYSSFDLVYVDIDHSGTVESLIHEKLVSDEFRGDVFYDDIAANDQMAHFWSKIVQPKLALDWHQQGFGVVRYGGGNPRLKMTSVAPAQAGEGE